MSTISSPSVPSYGYPPNAVARTNMTKYMSEYNYDTNRQEIADSFEKLVNPPKPNYTWPIIGLATSIIGTLVLCGIKRGKP